MSTSLPPRPCRLCRRAGGSPSPGRPDQLGGRPGEWRTPPPPQRPAGGGHRGPDLLRSPGRGSCARGMGSATGYRPTFSHWDRRMGAPPRSTTTWAPVGRGEYPQLLLGQTQAHEGAQIVPVGEAGPRQGSPPSGAHRGHSSPAARSPPPASRGEGPQPSLGVGIASAKIPVRGRGHEQVRAHRLLRRGEKAGVGGNARCSARCHWSSTRASSRRLSPSGHICPAAPFSAFPRPSLPSRLEISVNP